MKVDRWRIIFTMVLTVLTLVSTVMDARAVLIVRAMPNGVTSKVNAWDSGPYTSPGATLELWGNVTYDGGLPLQYTWNFGAGEGSASGTVSDARNIAANHVYAAGGSYLATLTVTDGTQSDSATVAIDVVPSTFAVQKNLTIQRALKYLYMTKGVWDYYGNGSCMLSYWNGGSDGRGLAVLAFEDYGHKAFNDTKKDIYALTVRDGLEYIFYNLASTGTSNSPNAYSDINSNGVMWFDGSQNMYYIGISTMALSNAVTSAAPGAERPVTSCSNAGLAGLTYKTLVSDMVDFIAYAQEERGGCSIGGWRYGPNYCSSDNSVSQWPTLGLAAAAGAPFNVTAPNWVKTLLQGWITTSQYSNGGFGYTYSSEWVNLAKTGAGVIEMIYAGGGGNLTNALNYLGGYNWTSPDPWSDYGNIGDHYAMYAVKKGLQYAGITSVGGYNWQQIYDQWLVGSQINAGTDGVYWPDSQRIGGSHMTAAFGLLVMAQGLVELPPVAVAGPDQEVAPNRPVTFNGSGSYHTDPTKHIVKYEWDYAYDGVSFNPLATGAIVTKADGFALPSGVPTKQFTVALRVTDDSVPPRTSIDTLIVTVNNGNVAPVANPGGPYLGAVGQNITFDASKSYDINAVGGINPIPNPATPSGFDEIVDYEWTIDGVVYHGKTVTVNFGNFIGTKSISLKVTDSFGASSAQSSQATTVAVSDLYPISYVKTTEVYNRATGKWTMGWKMYMVNRGNADATVVSAVLTGANIPPNVTVLDGNLTWTCAANPTGLVGAAQSVLSCDDFRISFPRGTAAPDLTKMTWDIQFTDNLGTQHVIRSVPQ